MRKIDLTFNGEINEEIFKAINAYFPIIKNGQRDSSSIYIRFEIGDYSAKVEIKGYALFDYMKKNIAEITTNKIYEASDLKEIFDYIIRYNEFAPYNSYHPVEIINNDSLNMFVMRKDHWGEDRRNQTSYDGEAIVECVFKTSDETVKNKYLKEILTNRGEFYSDSTGYVEDMLKSKEFTNDKIEFFKHMSKEQMLEYLSELEEDELYSILSSMNNVDFFINHYTKEDVKQYKKERN